MKEYHKIETLFLRSVDTKKMLEGLYRNEAVEYLANNIWEFTEKIDGMNIRVHWDGHKVEFAGRTDRAQLPANLVNRLNELFGGVENEFIFEQTFGNKDVILFGEGYGAGIQKGGEYKKEQDFILFDVMINGTYVSRNAVEYTAQQFKLDVVPVVFKGTIPEAINYVKTCPQSTIGTAKMEGVVGRPLVEMTDRFGNRIICKIKVQEYK